MQGRGRRTGKGKGTCKRKEETIGVDKAGGNSYSPSSSGVCFNSVKLGKCEKDGCIYQHLSVGLLRNALGDTSGQGASSATESPLAKGAARGNALNT